MPSLSPEREQIPPSSSALSADPRWHLATRIVKSKSFVKSPFLTNFLLYVCDRELRGFGAEITEYQIGVRAFRRPADYNPGTDNVVRNYARLLRKRLEEYFLNEGRDEPIHIQIPLGGYVPVFLPFPADADPKPELAEYTDAPPLSPQPVDTGNLQLQAVPQPTFWKSWGRAIACSALSMAVVLLAVTIIPSLVRARTLAHASPDLDHIFWTEVFRPDRDTLIVPADSGLGILENLSHHSVHLEDYITGTYLPQSMAQKNVDLRSLKDVRTQQYTSVVDINVVVALSHLPERIPARFAIHYARDVRIDELKHSNAILLGSVHTNPWAELFQNRQNFVLEYETATDDSYVTNRHPLPPEARTYRNAWAEESRRTYAVLAFEPGMDGQGHVILIAGLTMAGTQAAADLLLNKNRLEPILRKALKPDHTIAPFEVLLETNSLGGDAPESHIVAERYGTIED
ncbi:hypothetical protein SAMN05421771_0253 [Granulicella pectinivorans]|uniref:Adenylate cyclase n=1 Tax=Granulicella pectinivorans TaxID=474950 RepID=A0A1I6L568_9BACT|nr:hypothetical protein SAMN05421771_0253 [Granulicella pectinivorans]